MVITADTSTNLLSRLQLKDAAEASQWTFQYQVTEPADHIFYVEPQPFWEPAEGKMIIHYIYVHI